MPLDLKRGIVRILAADGATTSGTGFILSEKGIIVTCSHVVQAEKLQVRGYPRPERVEIVFRANGQKAAARLLPQAWRAADGEDVAFLQLEGQLPEEVEPLPLGSWEGCAGHQFQSFGFPDQSPEEGLYGEGQLIEQTSILGMKVWQVKSSEITPGFSGGPVYDQEARRVVGMVTSIAAPDKFGRLSETAFVTPAETLFSILPEIAASDVRPYMGLAAFTEKDAEFFFGRRKLVEGLEEALRARPRFLLVMGPSGSGKSSLVQAGLIPRLRKGSVPGSDRWGIIVARPADRPFENLERAGLRGAYAGLAEAARGWMERNPGQEKLLLILDQFEEFLVTCPPDLRSKLWGALKDLLDSDIELTVMAVMRDDFYSRFAGDAPPAVLAWTQHGFFQVGSLLEKKELQEIIQRPASRVGLRLEEGLAEVIINDVLESSQEGVGKAGRSTVLPLLEFALTQLWERREQGVLTHQAYQAAGKVTGSLTAWADQICRALEKDGLGPVARRVFTDLVNLGDGSHPDSRRQRRLADLVHDGKDEKELEAVQKVVQRLADARLMTTSLDKGEESAQIIHDSLIREWARLQRWLKKDRAFLSWQRELEKDAREWRDTGEAFGRDEGRLLRGRRLEEAERWQSERGSDLGEGEREFVSASLDLGEREREKEEKARAEKERTRKRIIQGVVVFSIFSLALAGLAYDKMLEANDRKEEALARSLASQSEQMRGIAGSLTESILLAAESLQHKETLEGFLALQRGLRLSPLCISRVDFSGLAYSLAFSPDGSKLAIGNSRNIAYLLDIKSGKEILKFEHNDSVNALAFSPDGKILATGSENNRTFLWDTKSGKKIFEQQHNASINAIVFSPNGKILTTGSDDGIMNLSYVESGIIFLRIMFSSSVNAIAFSPDGNTLAVGSGHKALIIDIKTAKVLTVLEHDNRVRSLAFSPNERILATGSGNTAHLWNIESGKEMWRLEHDDSVTCVAFSPDGTYFATSSRDNTARLWMTKSGKELQIMDHVDSVYSVAFDPDGSKMATGSVGEVRLWDVNNESINTMAFSLNGKLLATRGSDRTKIWLWDAQTNELLQIFKINDSVEDMVFSPDGSKFAAKCSSDAVMLLDIETGTVLHELQINNSVGNMVFNPDGKRLAVENYDEIQLWDAQNGIELHRLRHNDSLRNMAFSPDGRILATCSDDTARLWDIKSGKEMHRLEHKYNVIAIAFSPDGKKLATGSIDMARLWDVRSGKKLKELEHDEPVNAVAFSPDGKILATASWDKKARLWEIDSGIEIMSLAHDGEVNALAFSPEGRRLVTGSDDKTARLWDIKSGEELRRIENDGPVNAVEFNIDGSILETRIEDGIPSIWMLDTSKIIEEACNRITRNMTHKEWARFMDDPDSDCLTCPSEGSFNQSSIWPWGRRECQPCGGSLG